MDDDRMVVYIAGPMRGYAQWNFPAFDDARARWREAGWEVISPADLDRAIGVDENTTELPPRFLNGAMTRDLPAICTCDAIALLPGWEKSSGVAVELALSRLLGLPEYDAVTMEPIARPTDEQCDVIAQFTALLWKVTGDGGRKRAAGLKPSWKVDESHERAIFSHLHKWKRGERVDSDSGAHPLVHLAWRALAIAWQENHAEVPQAVNV